MSLRPYVAPFALVLAFAASSAAVTVPGTSDPWLAGMPDGSTASSFDVAPAQSPVLAPFVLEPGGVLRFAVTGGVLNTPGCDPVTLRGCNWPDGSGFWGLWYHTTGPENGIADVQAPLNSLVGVFLDDTQPDSSPAPVGLAFGQIGIGFSSLSPALRQVFFIGDGLSRYGRRQRFYIPEGATRLFLGTMDGYDWSNNSGAYEVTLTDDPGPGIGPNYPAPEPSTYALFAAGLAVLGIVRRRR